MDGRVFAVVGACFGDEGKGMVTDFLSNADTAVVKHNGGAQAGHTVSDGYGRFVFHQLSSGSFWHAATVWADTYLPDLYKLGEEAEAFGDISGSIPDIYASDGTMTTVIDDVLINMALETSRGSARHGSCGMGIYEAVLRNDAGFGIRLWDLYGTEASALARRMEDIRREYVYPHIESCGLDIKDLGEYGELLTDNAVLHKAADIMMKNLSLTKPLDESILNRRIVFEGAQGLLLDSENTEYAPHVTASKTDLTNPQIFCQKHGISIDRTYCVMRSYVTRHGAGRLPYECDKNRLGNIGTDITNIPNPWQGHLRYAPHTSPQELFTPIARLGTPVTAVVTHLNETDGMIRFASGDIPYSELLRDRYAAAAADSTAASYSEYSRDLILS